MRREMGGPNPAARLLLSKQHFAKHAVASGTPPNWLHCIMGPALRRAAHTLCGRCSLSVRGQALRQTKTQLARPAVRYMSSSSSDDKKSPHVVASQNSTIPSRHFTSSAAKVSDSTSSGLKSSVKLAQDDLFHPFSTSPVPEFRRRAAFMRQHAFCPHPDHQQTKLPTIAPKPDDVEELSGSMPPAHVDFECPDCGLPVYCSEGHWMDDYEKHLEVCDTLRQINEDDHDLRSGRVFHEANLPDLQLDDAAVNMTNWDTFMYTREFDAVDSDRGMRQITRLLTYPITIGSVLHELSPYNMQAGGRLTAEGLKSFSGRSNVIRVMMTSANQYSSSIQSSSWKIWPWCWSQSVAT